MTSSEISLMWNDADWDYLVIKSKWIFDINLEDIFSYNWTALKMKLRNVFFLNWQLKCSNLNDHILVASLTALYCPLLLLFDYPWSSLFGHFKLRLYIVLLKHHPLYHHEAKIFLENVLNSISHCEIQSYLSFHWKVFIWHQRYLEDLLFFSWQKKIMI